MTFNRMGAMGVHLENQMGIRNMFGMLIILMYYAWMWTKGKQEGRGVLSAPPWQSTRGSLTSSVVTSSLQFAQLTEQHTYGPPYFYSELFSPTACTCDTYCVRQFGPADHIRKNTDWVLQEAPNGTNPFICLIHTVWLQIKMNLFVLFVGVLKSEMLEV